MSWNKTYNISGLNQTDATQFMADLNSQVNQLPAIGLVILIYVGVFSMYVNNGAVRAHITGSVAASGIGILLFFAGMLSPDIIMIPISLLVLGMIALGFTDKNR